MKTLSLSVLCALTLALPAAAWNKPGHMATAAVAFHELKDNKPLREKLVAILREHPSYANTWKPLVDEGARGGLPEAEVLLMLAARWPDDSPDGHSGQKGEWHYINVPLAFDGTVGKPPKSNNIVTSFADRVQDFKTAPETPDGKVQKAISLCWILHQIGDAHQPLHSVSLFSERFGGKGGDLGGNLFYVRYSAGATTYKLHAVWDEGITTRYELTGLHKLTLNLRLENPRSHFPKVTESRMQGWIDESAALARTAVYLNGALKSGPNKTQGELLPDGYSKERGRLSKERGTLAGYRMADWLKTSVL